MVLDPDSIGSVDPDWDSGSRQAKVVLKRQKNEQIFMFEEFSVRLEASPWYSRLVRGVLGNKCAGQHNLKTVQIREIMWK